MVNNYNPSKFTGNNTPQFCKTKQGLAEASPAIWAATAVTAPSTLMQRFVVQQAQSPIYLAKNLLLLISKLLATVHLLGKQRLHPINPSNSQPPAIMSIAPPGGVSILLLQPQ
jgi:hypothetical protein